MGTNSCSVLMTNPLDYAKRESFSQATEMSIEEVRVVSATLFDAQNPDTAQVTKRGCRARSVSASSAAS